MSNTYIKVTIEKKRHTQNFSFLNLKSCLLIRFYGALNHADIIKFSSLLLQLKNHSFESKTGCGFSMIFVLKEIITF